MDLIQQSTVHHYLDLTWKQLLVPWLLGTAVITDLHPTARYARIILPMILAVGKNVKELCLNSALQ